VFRLLRFFPKRVLDRDKSGLDCRVGICARFFALMWTENTMTHVNAGQTAPGFSLKGLEGKSFRWRTDEKGPVRGGVLKISCPVCQFTFPFLQRLISAMGTAAVTFLGISQDDAKATASFAREYGATFPIVLDEKEKGYPASNAYGLTSVPTIS